MMNDVMGSLAGSMGRVAGGVRIGRRDRQGIGVARLLGIQVCLLGLCYWQFDTHRMPRPASLAPLLPALGLNVSARMHPVVGG